MERIKELKEQQKKFKEDNDCTFQPKILTKQKSNYDSRKSLNNTTKNKRSPKAFY